MRGLFFLLTTLFLTPLANSSDMELRADYIATLTPQYTGPNCWNTSMMTFGALDNFRFVDLTEFEYYLRKYCRKLDKDEPLENGILIVAREYDDSDFIDEVLHSFIYFSDDKAFSKDSREPVDVPHFDPFKTAFVFASYKHFYYKIPYGFSGNLATPYSCDFKVKPAIPTNIKNIMDLFHQINTGEINLTTDVYEDLVKMADDIGDLKGKGKHYSRILMDSVREQIRFYKKFLDKIK